MTGHLEDFYPDEVSIVGAMCLGVVVLAYLFSVIRHFNFLVKPAEQILVLRVSMLLPIYATMLELILLFPNGEPIFESLSTLYEAYALFAFFMMMIVHCDGKAGTLHELSLFTGSCACCVTTNPSFYYSFTRASVMQMILIRPIATLISGFSENENTITVTKMIALASVVWGVFWLLRMYKALAERVHDIHAKSKIIVIKVIILIIMIQAVVVEALFAANVLSTGSDVSEHDEEMKARRLYAFVCLIEFTLFALIVAHAYSSKPYRIEYEEVVLSQRNRTENEAVTSYYLSESGENIHGPTNAARKSTITSKSSTTQPMVANMIRSRVEIYFAVTSLHIPVENLTAIASSSSYSSNLVIGNITVSFCQFVTALFSFSDVYNMEGENTGTDNDSVIQSLLLNSADSEVARPNKQSGTNGSGSDSSNSGSRLSTKKKDNVADAQLDSYRTRAGFL